MDDLIRFANATQPESAVYVRPSDVHAIWACGGDLAACSTLSLAGGGMVLVLGTPDDVAAELRKPAQEAEPSPIAVPDLATA